MVSVCVRAQVLGYRPSTAFNMTDMTAMGWQQLRDRFDSDKQFKQLFQSAESNGRRWQVGAGSRGGSAPACARQRHPTKTQWVSSQHGTVHLLPPLPSLLSSLPWLSRKQQHRRLRAAEKGAGNRSLPPTPTPHPPGESNDRPWVSIRSSGGRGLEVEEATRCAGVTPALRQTLLGLPASALPTGPRRAGGLPLRHQPRRRRKPPGVRRHKRGDPRAEVHRLDPHLRHHRHVPL